jgi:hypothetical protein
MFVQQITNYETREENKLMLQNPLMKSYAKENGNFSVLI